MGLAGIIILFIVALLLIAVGAFLTITLIYSLIGIPLILIGIFLIVIAIVNIVTGTTKLVFSIPNLFKRKNVVEMKKVNGVYKEK